MRAGVHTRITRVTYTGLLPASCQLRSCEGLQRHRVHSLLCSATITLRPAGAGAVLDSPRKLALGLISFGHSIPTINVWLRELARPQRSTTSNYFSTTRTRAFRLHGTRWHRQVHPLEQATTRLFRRAAGASSDGARGSPHSLIVAPSQLWPRCGALGAAPVQVPPRLSRSR